MTHSLISARLRAAYQIPMIRSLSTLSSSLILRCASLSLSLFLSRSVAVLESLSSLALLRLTLTDSLRHTQIHNRSSPVVSVNNQWVLVLCLESIYYY